LLRAIFTESQGFAANSFFRLTDFKVEKILTSMKITKAARRFFMA
jgi:hypothetical protein